MCCRNSFIVARDHRVFWWPFMDSHSEIETKCGIDEVGYESYIRKYAKVEIRPPDSAQDRFDCPPADQWELYVDEDVFPTWWNGEYASDAWAALAKIIKAEKALEQDYKFFLESIADSYRTRDEELNKIDKESMEAKESMEDKKDRQDAVCEASNTEIADAIDYLDTKRDLYMEANQLP